MGGNLSPGVRGVVGFVYELVTGTLNSGTALAFMALIGMTRERAAFMEHWKKILSDDTVLKQTILSGDRVSGNVVSFDQSGERLLGFWLGADHWGRGIATAALSEFLRSERTRPLVAHVFKQNIGSIRVLEKCGFARSNRDGGEEYIFTLAK